MVFFSKIPSLGLGTLTVRENHKMYNTEKEKSMLNPENNDLLRLSKECNADRVAVDLFCCVNQFIDLASLSPLVHNTGGDLYYYQKYQARTDGERLHYDLFRVLTRNTAYDVSIRCRCSTGLSVCEYYGSFVKRNTIDFDLPSFDADKSLGILLRHEGKLKEGQFATVQLAMLYTSVYGERRIRVLNLQLSVVGNIQTLYKSLDVEGVLSLMTKRELARSGTATSVGIKESLIATTVNILYGYRTHCSSSSSPTQLILPDAVKLLPLYLLSLMKTPVSAIFLIFLKRLFRLGLQTAWRNQG